MVLGLFIITAIPTVTGIGQAYSAQKTHEERQKDEKRMKKFHIDVCCEAQSSRTKEIHEGRLVLKDDKVWIGPHEALNPCKEGYVAEAFYIEYPDNQVSNMIARAREWLYYVCWLTGINTSERSGAYRPCQPSPRQSSASELDIRGQGHDGIEIWKQDGKHRSSRGTVGLDRE